MLIENQFIRENCIALEKTAICYKEMFAKKAWGKHKGSLALIKTVISEWNEID